MLDKTNWTLSSLICRQKKKHKKELDKEKKNLRIFIAIVIILL